MVIFFVKKTPPPIKKKKAGENKNKLLDRKKPGLFFWYIGTYHIKKHVFLNIS